MSGNTFTLNVSEGASIDVTVVKVTDSTFADLVRLYIQSIRLRTSQSVTTRTYQVRITQPTTLPTGYTSTGAATTLLLSTRTTFTAAGTGTFDGLYTFTNGASTLIGTQQVQPQSTNDPCQFTLETSTDGITYTAVPFTGTGTNYTFDIGDGTNRQYDTKGVDRSSATLLGNASTLYFKSTYNTAWPAATLNVNGSSTVVIGGDTYNAIFDSAGTIVTSGNDFTLYVPNSVNTDGIAGAILVEDKQTVAVPTLEYNLMDLALTTAGTQGGTFQNGTTGTSVSKTTERGDAIDFYALLPWSQVTIDSIEEVLGTRIAVNDIVTPTYYGTFSYHGTTYTLTIVTDSGSGKKNVYMKAQTSYGATTSVTLYRIWIRPGVAGGGTKVL